MFINKPHEKTNLRETNKILVAIRSLNKKLLYLLGTLFWSTIPYILLRSNILKCSAILLRNKEHGAFAFVDAVAIIAMHCFYRTLQFGLFFMQSLKTAVLSRNQEVANC